MSEYALSGSFAHRGRTLRMMAPLRRLLRDFADHYRPELHYMRGPGPKWREKHAQQPQPQLEIAAGNQPTSS